ncbi:hypothetical protein [Halorussus caseinilyticus]|uniref:Calcium-binding protein n=1 Tax=Halorussus caseinilyticus TaxID=3034025 RepID=A0ABD5WJU1_9EURY
MKRDSDGDGLTNGLEQLGVKTGTGRVSTDPYDADTDGDGITDGAEVAGYIPRYVDGGYFELRVTRPRSIRTVTVSVTPRNGLAATPSDTRNRVPTPSSSSRHYTTAATPVTHQVSRTVDPDPMRQDSDDDGLDDGRELDLGTDPTRADTDGDGIADAEERRGGSDPTLADYEGPTIDVFRAEFGKDAFSGDTSYAVGYRVDDPSGVASSRLTKNGEIQTRTTWGGDRHGSQSRAFETGLPETILDGLTGTSVVVHARDTHDNRRQQVAMERANVYGATVKELTTQSDLGPERASMFAGMLSGFTVGAGSTAQTVKALTDQPLAFLGAFEQLATLVDRLGLIDKILATLPRRMVESLEAKQATNNPYDRSDPSEQAEYDAFRVGWYTGYVAFQAVQLVVGGQAQTAVKNSDRFADLVDRLDRNGRLSEAKRYYDVAKGRTTGRAKQVTFELGGRAAKGSWHLSKKSGRRVVAGVKTAAGKYDARQRLSNAEASTHSQIDALSPGDQRVVGRVLARTDDPEIIADGGDNFVAIMRQADDIDPDVAKRLANQSATTN